MNDRYLDIINVIARCIPFRKLRDSVRDYLHWLFEATNGVEMLIHSFGMYQYILDYPEEFKKDIEEFKNGLDDYSLKVLDTWMIQMNSLVQSKVQNLFSYSIPPSTNFFTDEQKIVWASRYTILNSISKRYILKYGDIKNIPISLHINYYECGIVYLPTRVKNRFTDSIALDLGAWVGDSAIMLLEEHNFLKVYAFEPMPKTFNQLEYAVKKYALEERIKCHPYGASDRDGEFFMDGDDAGAHIIKDSCKTDICIKTLKLDDYLSNEEAEISLIKIDIEGHEEQALIGAENIIRKHKPVLLISCYHDWIALGQMFRLKKFVENLDLGYKIVYRGLNPNCTNEYNLICYVD